MKPYTLAILSALMVFSMPAFSEGLTSEELIALYQGNTLIGEHHKKGGAKVYFAPDGTYQCKFDNGKNDAGKWWIDGNLRCIENAKGQEYCHITEKLSDGTYSVTKAGSGKEICIITSVEKGNQL